MRHAVFTLCVLLAGCGDWPDAGGPELNRNSTDWPELRPLSELVEGEDLATASDDDARRLAARAADLRNRARILRQDAGDADAMEALRARLR